MKILHTINILCIAAGLATVAPALAALANPTPSSYNDDLVVQVRGCHPEVRRHFVPEFGSTAWHFHRGNCRPVPAAGPGGEVRDCHRDVRRHYLPRFGARVTHRHVGPSCRIRVYREYNPGRPRPGNCIQIGPVRYCEY